MVIGVKGVQKCTMVTSVSVSFVMVVLRVVIVVIVTVVAGGNEEREECAFIKSMPIQSEYQTFSNLPRSPIAFSKNQFPICISTQIRAKGASRAPKRTPHGESNVSGIDA